LFSEEATNRSWSSTTRIWKVVCGLGHVPGFEKFEVASAGYINARVNRQEAARLLLDPKATQPGSASRKKILVEHTSINLNATKALT